MACLDSTLSERFWKKIDKNGLIPAHCPELGPCWIWLAYKDEYGRGQIATSKGLRHAHKVSWELLNGPVPDGMCLLHRCDNQGCPNPAHLRLGTQAENMIEARDRGRFPSGIRHWTQRGARQRTIKTKLTLEERFWPKVNKNSSAPEHCPELGNCWLWTGSTNRDGYGLFGIGGSGNTMVAHKVHWLMIAKRELPDGMKLLHKCDNPGCVRLEHLFVGTHSDNMRDMLAKGRQHFPEGTEHYRTQMTFEQATEIRRLHHEGISLTELAKRFERTLNMIGKIVNGKHWLRPRGY